MTISGTPITELSPLAGPTPVPVLQRSRILRLPRNPKVIAGLVLMAPFVLVSFVGRWITPYDPNTTDIQHWVRHVLVEGTGPSSDFPAVYYPLPLPPSAGHLLGTTVFAQDVLSQLLASTQATLFVGLLAAAIATVLSVLVGVAAGYLGGNADEGLSLFSNVFLAIPGLPLLIVLADYVPSAGSSILLVAVIIAVTAWAYRRGQIPYRRGDWAAAAAFTVFLTPAVVIGSRAAGAELAVGLAAVLSVLPSLALEVCWRPLFLAALRRLSHLNLDLLVHESLREHYGDDWQAYAAHIRADLREARRLRELAERGPAKTDEP